LDDLSRATEVIHATCNKVPDLTTTVVTWLQIIVFTSMISFACSTQSSHFELPCWIKFLKCKFQVIITMMIFARYSLYPWRNTYLIVGVLKVKGVHLELMCGFKISRLVYAMKLDIGKQILGCSRCWRIGFQIGFHIQIGT
jgi:hypothetical protein